MQNFAPSCRCPENDGVYGVQSLADPDIIDLIEFDPREWASGADHLSAPTTSSSPATGGGSARSRPGWRWSRHPPQRISYAGDREAFLKLLVEANTQRKKTAGMLLREAAMKVDPEQAYDELKQEQREKDRERRFGSNVSDATGGHQER